MLPVGRLFAFTINLPSWKTDSIVEASETKKDLEIVKKLILAELSVKTD